MTVAARPVAGPAALARSARTPLRRAAEVTVLVAVWVGLGFGPARDPLVYLLVGIPLVVLFQVAVCRRPLTALWLRNGGRLRRPPAAVWVLTVLGLGAMPAWTAVQEVAAHRWTSALWAVAATDGAIVASFVVLQRFVPGARRERSGARYRSRGLGPATGAFAIGATVFLVAALPTIGARGWDPGAMAAVAARSWLLYLPALFVMEEVAFRGCIDTHLFPPAGAAPAEATGRGGVTAALLSSALWGLWHLPLMAGRAPTAVLVPYLLVVHVAIGVPLALAWRRSGSLALPAAAHAAMDAVRNALSG